MRLRNLTLFIFSFLFLIFLFSFGKYQVLVSPSHPVIDDEIDSDIDEKVRQYGVTFPISELGNCESYLECRTYCEDPVHFDACIAFAKKKGFYNGEGEEKIKSVLARAKSVLGCDSYDSCKSVCSKEENFDKCAGFAESSGLSGGYVHDPRAKEFLNKAKEFLGCDSYDSCRNFCENPANRDRCAQFAASIGAYGGYEYKGPGGCTSPETCRAFCTNPSNFEICKKFAESQGGSFGGPGGCTDEASCRSYCEKNPQACPMGDTSYGDPSLYCSRTPGCSWNGSTCQCSSTGYTGDPAAECQKYGCTWSGSYCQCASYDTNYYERYKSECTKYPGCSWTGNSCECSTQVNYQADPSSECSKYPGCSWNGSTCQCEGTTYQEPPEGGTSYCQPPSSGCGEGNYWDYSSCTCKTSENQQSTSCPSGYYWNGSSCAPSSGETTSGQQEPTSAPQPTPGVYGAATVRTVIQALIQYIFER